MPLLAPSQKLFKEKALHLSFLYNGSQRVAIAFNISQKGFCRTKVQVHIQAYRQVVTVVCNIEGNDFFFLLFFSHIFYEREHQTTIRHPVFSLIILLTAINQSLFLHCPSGMEKRIFCPGLYSVGSYERACKRILSISYTHTGISS